MRYIGKIRYPTISRTENIMNDVFTTKLARSEEMSPLSHLVDVAFLSTAFDPLIRKIHSWNIKNNVGDSSLNEKDDKKVDNITVIKNLDIELKKHGIEMVVGGSIAAMVSIPPRATKDIDVNIRDVNNIPISEEKLRGILSNIHGVDTSKFFYTSGIVPKKRSLVTPSLVSASFKYMNWPIDVYLSTEGETFKKLFSNPVVIDDMKFAPLECICLWKMMSFKSDHRYFKDRSDVVSILLSTNIDTNWVKKQLILHDGENGERTKEWNELVLDKKINPHE